MAGSAHDLEADTSLRLQILGPMRLWRDGVELGAGPRQQAQLLALLLARAGRPIGVGELIDLLWGEDAPVSARGVIQKYVSGLRRLLEPGVAARTTGSYLHTHGDGYVFRARPGTLDLVTFRELRAAASGERDRTVALDVAVRALALWQGRAGGEPTGRSAAVFAALDDEFLTACAESTELALSLGRPERVLPALRLAVSTAPLHEPVQAAFVAALGAAGRQAEALSVFQVVRDRLADELGVDPGPALRAAHQRVLTPVPVAAGGDTAAPRLVGRIEELTVLREVVGAALTGGTALGVVEGEPGAGKTRLVEEAAAEANRGGALVVWGSCLEGGGTPSMWPWSQALRTILDHLPPRLREKWLSGEMGGLLEGRETASAGGGRAQFRLSEQVVSVIGTVSADRPVLLVLDDLQWADTASLQLFGHVAGRLPAGTAVVASLRDRAPTPGSELSRVLAAAARVPGHRRMRLGPLGRDDVAELVRQETGHDPGPGVTRDIHARTAGNPFFARELSRLLRDRGTLGSAVDDADDGATARLGVPATVRDVVRGRMAGLDDAPRDLLQVAALIGRDVDLAVLARAAGVDVADCLGLLEPLRALGLLEAHPDDPFTWRFAHDLVRESVTETTPHQRAGRLHLSVADALDERLADDDSLTESVAYHLWTAGPLADPVRTVEALKRAGRCATTKLAFTAADRHLETAAQVARAAGLPELELSALSQLAIAPRRQAGFGGTTADLLERAEHLARGLGRDVEAAGLLFARLFGAYTFLDADRALLVRRLHEQGEASADPAVRVYGRQAWGLHLWDTGDIGAAHRYLRGNDPVVDGEAPVRRDVSGEWPGWRAVVTALRGDVAAAMAEIERWNAPADPYAIATWAYYATMIAALAGDADAVLRAVQRWLALGSGHQALQQEHYIRLDHLWARALTGDDPAGNAAAAEQLLASTLVDPPRFGVAFHHALIAEMWLAAGEPDRADRALDHAELALDAYGQRYAEGLVLVLRARLSHVRGEPDDVVRAALVAARTLARERGAHLFTRRPVPGSDARPPTRTRRP